MTLASLLLPLALPVLAAEVQNPSVPADSSAAPAAAPQQTAAAPQAASPEAAPKKTSETARPAAKAAAPQPASPAAAAQTDDDKTLYALGVVLGRNLVQFSLTSHEYAAVEKGIRDATFRKAPTAALETYGPKIEPLRKARVQVQVERFFAKIGKEPGFSRTASGLFYKELRPGNGKSPKAEDTVKVHYHGTLMDGSVFDSSVQRGEPAEFPLKGVIPCWTEGVQKMKVHGKSKLVCPAELAYGDRGTAGIPGGSPLTFEVELLEIVKK